MASTSVVDHTSGSDCFICKGGVEAGELTVVKARGVATLLECSVKRKLAADEQFLHGLSEVRVHRACQARYINEKLIAAFVRRGYDTPTSPCPVPTLRSQVTKFDFTNSCFFCEEAIADDFRVKQAKLPFARRNAPVKVTLPEMATTIIGKARMRGDEWGKKVEERISQLHNLHTDLVAVNAEYHQKCLASFYHSPKSEQERGFRPASSVDEAMQVIFSYLDENCDECQFSIQELIELIEEDSRPHSKTVRSRLQTKYGDQIIISESRRGPVVSLKRVGDKILYDNWYSTERKGDVQEERRRIVEAAGNIILEDIRSRVFNTVEYPPSDNFLGNARTEVPETLLLLLNVLILTNKRGSLDSWKNKCLALAHAIIIAVRPKSFLSSIMIAVSVFVYKKFGSKHLLHLLSSMGFSSSYEEANRLEGSYVLQAESVKIVESAEPFSQFIFDNADFNVNTLDGHDTFHAMGGIMAVTPRQAVATESKIARLKVSSAAEVIADAGIVEVISYHRPPNAGLKTIKIADIDISNSQRVVPSPEDIAWLYGKNSADSSSVPGWNGFMELGTTGEKYECSKIVFLPFINAPPSDYNTVYTSIASAVEQCKLVKQKTCIVTFDQPLYWKARDVMANDAQPELKNVVVRLGGFHLLMSFMGAMGTIMDGSGLKELFSTIYATKSVEKILTGHAYARAVRANILTYAALAGKIFEDTDFTDQELRALDELLNSPDRSCIFRGADDLKFHAVTERFSEMLTSIEKRGPTAALWIQYFRMCTLLMNYIKAERMGNWKLHLHCVKEMIPYFHAAGHLNYAKSAHLYYQDMVTIQDRMDPREYKRFTTDGYFTIRRSEKFWSGIWSDMSIEQVLMRAMKSYGGLTRGRGVSDSVLARWTLGMLCLQSICEEIELFADVRSETSEQHVDMRPTRVVRDNMDIGKLHAWFNEHPPFIHIQAIVSLSTGIIGHGDVNCHLAREIGISCVKKVVGGNFEELKLKRKDKVVTLASVCCSLKIANKSFTVDPLTLFQRVCVVKKSDEDLKELLKFELAPFPMSLFTEEGIRKGTKSAMYSLFNPIEEVNLGNRKCNVIDGGYLLHKVVWNTTPTTTFDMLCSTYNKYVLRYFGNNVIVVFDGYPTDAGYQSTKAAERARRSALQSPTKLSFSSSTMVTIAQEKFLANDHSKSAFISMLMTRMVGAGIEVKQAFEDADVMIVKTAISKASEFDAVIITAEDVDILILLTALGALTKNIYLQKSGRGSGSSVLYSSSSCSFPPKDILFLHAVSGCDTTSAPFGFGKKKICSTYMKNTSLSAAVAPFLAPNATPQQISDAGEKFLVAVYGGDIDNDNLDDLRYRLFTRSVTTAKLQLARLPPTMDAAKYHSLRTYQQVQAWLGNELLPSLWGWSITTRGVLPISTTRNAAPDDILKIVSCKCSKGCSTGSCSCKKAGLRCSAMCKHCAGLSCENAPATDLNEEDSPDIVGEYDHGNDDVIDSLIDDDDDELLEAEPTAKKSRH